MWLAASGLVVASAVLVMALWPTKLVILRLDGARRPTGPPTFVLLNPARDKAPEAVASTLFEGIMAHSEPSRLTALAAPDIAEYEMACQLTAWRLVGSEHLASGEIELEYYVERRPPCFDSRTTVGMVRLDGAWRIRYLAGVY